MNLVKDALYLEFKTYLSKKDVLYGVILMH